MFNFSEKIWRNKKVIVAIAVVVSTTVIVVASYKIKHSPKTPQPIESISSSPTPMVEATKEAFILPSPSSVVTQTRLKPPPSALVSPQPSTPPSSQSPTTPTPAPSVEGTKVTKSAEELRREKLNQLAQQPNWCPDKEWYDTISDSMKTCPVEPNPLAVAFNLCYGRNLGYTGNREDIYDICAQEIGL